MTKNNKKTKFEIIRDLLLKKGEVSRNELMIEPYKIERPADYMSRISIKEGVDITSIAVFDDNGVFRDRIYKITGELSEEEIKYFFQKRQIIKEEHDKAKARIKKRIAALKVNEFS